MSLLLSGSPLFLPGLPPETRRAPEPGSGVTVSPGRPGGAMPRGQGVEVESDIRTDDLLWQILETPVPAGAQCGQNGRLAALVASRVT
ncbi:hypothetical protein AB0C07_10995 [Actinoplanes missouriensis]|uniref:hypothetical protein n=1 Tax=Actinoplanes missouriensis TaxID=1866 RepID=UPI0033DB91F1